MIDKITVRGAREHNLKNINLEIPKNKFVVFTGVSGSGKSSLAFDTIYAEGQRRYVESLSAYARQFLGIMNKPDVDTIEGLSPAISIDQKTTSHNPRSTVGTITEIYDYLRLLYARIGHPHCPNCKIEIRKLTIDEIVENAYQEMVKITQKNKLKPQEFRIYSPIVRQKKGEFKDLLENILSKGYINTRVDGKKLPIQSNISLIKTNKHDIDVEIDIISAGHADLKSPNFVSNLKKRLATDIEQSSQLSDGLMVLNHIEDYLFSEKFSCPNCGLSLPELEPRMFSFNSPFGACIECKGIGHVYKVDADSIINQRLSINEGAILPFNKVIFLDTWYIRLLKTALIKEGVNLDVAVKNLNKGALDIVLYGTKNTYRVTGENRQGKHTSFESKFDGVIAELERKFFQREGGSDMYDVYKYIREETCESCKGKRLKKEILAVTIKEKNISDLSEMSIDDLVNTFTKSYLIL